LKNCKPDDCQLQVSASGIEALQKSVDLSAPDAKEKVNQYFDRIVIERLLAYGTVESTSSALCARSGGTAPE
jgi:hypothetical protein